MAKSIGIDLGTTNSVGAIKRVHTEVLKNAEGDLITPSCVALKKGKSISLKPDFIVGKHALEWMKQDPENTIVAVKRLMGRNYHDEGVRRIISDGRLRYRIGRHSRGSENSVGITLGGKEYTPEEISSKILGKIRRDAEKQLKDVVEYAVITVPAYFNDKQKHATRTAAALTGLKVRRLLPEPTAAAISFGVDSVKGDEVKTVLVFDFGGGTFDLSVLTISGGNFIEHGKGGDMWLGGEDIDHLIVDFALRETAGEYGIDDIRAFIEGQEERRKNLFLGELKAKAEKAKILLSEEESAYIEVLGVLKDSDGDNVDVDVELTRDGFNDMIIPILETATRIIRKLIEDIHFTPDLIDKVLLVGGSSRIPRVVEAMEELFGSEKVIVHERPMLAIAEGAAILSHRLADTYECPRCGNTVSQSDRLCGECEFDLERYLIDEGVVDIVHSAAHDYYIHLENNERHLFVEKNTPLPCERTEVFKLVHPEQKLVHMKFFNVVNEKEESIGDLWLGIDEDEKEEKKGPFNVEITLRIDENNLIEVEAVLKERPDVKLSRTLSRGKADEKLFLGLEEAILEVNERQYTQYVIVDFTHRSLSALKETHRVVNPETGEVDESLYEKVALKIEKARKMAAEGHSPRTTIYYGELALEDFGPAIPPQTRKAIQKKIARLKEMDENGTYQENVHAYEELKDVLEDIGAVAELMEIQKAGEFCMETDPAKAPKYFRAVEDILNAYRNGDLKEAHRIQEEILSEVYDIVDQYESKTGIVYKDITR
ncbi:MAG: Hsp70 family protein [Pseudomonadota bacterium]